MLRSAILAAYLTASALPVMAAPAQPAQWRVDAAGDLSALLDCHEAAGRALVSAHRGGHEPGLPENSIEAMDAVLVALPAIMEIDVAQSSDGVLYLMHDRTLDRTTDGTGAVAERDWAYVEQLRLVDEAGWVTSYGVPTFIQALEWAKSRTVLQIDFKATADEGEVVEAIREHGLAGQVILIAYSLEQALRLHALAPEMLISYSADAPGDIDAAIAAGIPAERIVAFTGTRTVRPDLYAALDALDIEVIFGTLGRSANSIDNVIDRFGMDERYAELSRGGVDIIATDRPREAALALAEAGRLGEAGLCGVSRGAG